MGSPGTGVNPLPAGDGTSGGTGTAAVASAAMSSVAVRLRTDHKSGAVSRTSGSEPAGSASSSAAG
jgi:hypothetical protein